MAVDRVLLESTALPILRIYRWAQPCVTIGYFESMAEAQIRYPSLPIVRRWTGGGTVLHGQDAPYSLIVPRTEPFATVRPGESYRLIHGALANALRTTMPEVTPAREAAPKRSNACFENPVADDLMAKGCKIAGAGQRRSRAGLLHQGSLQIGTSDFPHPHNFATLLASAVQSTTLPAEMLERALSLNQKPIP
jgi:lipoate-protein ligase A